MWDDPEYKGGITGDAQSRRRHVPLWPFRRRRPQLLAVGAVALALAACNLPSTLPLAPPTAIPSPSPGPTSEPATATATGAAPPTQPPTSGPPTAAPPEGGPAVELEPLAAGSEIALRRVAMLDAERGWGTGGLEADDNRVLRTRDGGQTWQDVTPPLFFAEGGASLHLQAFFLDFDRAWAFRYHPSQGPGPQGRTPLVVWATVDGGASWQRGEPRWVPFLGAVSSPPYLRFTDAEEGWLLARRGGAGMHQYPVALLHTEDGGTSWIVQEDPFQGTGLQGCHKSGMAFGGSGTGMLSIDSCPIVGAEVRVSRDGGATWEDLGLPEPDEHPSLHEEAGCESHSPAVFDDDSWVVGASCRVFSETTETLHFLYWTDDGGDSWRILRAPTGSLLFVDAETAFALGRDIHRTEDGGASWEQRKVVSWDGQFSFVDASNGWAVARSGEEIALVRTDDGASTWRILNPEVGESPATD